MARHKNYDPADVVGVNWATVLVGTKGPATPFPDISNFKFEDATTYPTGFVPLGLTSRESLPSVTTDGGEETVLDTAEMKNVESLTSGKSFSIAFTVHSLNKNTLKIAFGGGKDESQFVKGSGTSTQIIQGISSGDNSLELPVLIIYSGGGKNVGLYWPRVKVSGGTLADVSMESLMALNFTGKMLQPTTEHLKEITKVFTPGGSHEGFFIKPSATATTAKAVVALEGGDPASPVPAVVPGG